MGAGTVTAAYYEDKVAVLADIFGAEIVSLVPGGIAVDGSFFPVVDDVIVALAPDRIPPEIRDRLDRLPDGTRTAHAGNPQPFAPEVQRGFGEEWASYPDILAEHEDEFRAYFDLVDLDRLAGMRVADLGCGIGRWSYYLAERCRQVVLVDYSRAIFVARHNLRSADNAVFVMADVLDLPFRHGAFDLVVCLGVLHHLPVDALSALRGLGPYGDRHLAYLYYALDNRPAYFRWLLAAVTRLRRGLSNIRSPRIRAAVVSAIVVGVYIPLVRLGPLLRRLRIERFVPLVETYDGKSLERLRQDAYDRFFTSIEQRFSRREIGQLTDTFSSVTISDGLPYWHFMCEYERTATASVGDAQR